MKFPKTISVLQFVSGDNCELLETRETLHREVITETDKSEVLRLDGGHYLYDVKIQEVIEKVREWLQKSRERMNNLEIISRLDRLLFLSVQPGCSFSAIESDFL